MLDMGDNGNEMWRVPCPHTMYSLGRETYLYKIIIHINEKGTIIGKYRQKSEGEIQMKNTSCTKGV